MRSNSWRRSRARLPAGGRGGAGVDAKPNAYKSAPCRGDAVRARSGTAHPPRRSRRLDAALKKQGCQGGYNGAQELNLKDAKDGKTMESGWAIAKSNEAMSGQLRILSNKDAGKSCTRALATPAKK